MAKTSTAKEVGQGGSLREGLEAAIRERVREIIEMVSQEEVEAALGAGRGLSALARAAGSFTHPKSALFGPCLQAASCLARKPGFKRSARSFGHG